MKRSQALALAAIVAGGLAIRLVYLSWAIHTPGYTWSDPDGYLERGLLLARGPHGWHWSWDVARYRVNGRVYALPPLYSIFLSVIAIWPGLPVSALIVQAVLATATIATVFALGLLVHSIRAGLIAAMLFAVWGPSIFGVWSTGQEAVYLPVLFLAFVLLGRAVTNGAPASVFAGVGVMFGLAALARSMPLFFIPPAGLAHVLMAPNRRLAVKQAGALLAGFALLVAPYSLLLSRNLGQVTIIDSHGSIHLDDASGAQLAPGLGATASSLLRAIAADPARYLAGTVSRATTIFHVNGGRQLQIYVAAVTRASSLAWKVLVHLGTDGLLILAVVLAPLGVVICRNTKIAVLIAMWALLNVAIASVGGFGGARLRTPFEPLLMTIGAAVLAGEWKRRRWVALAAGTLVSGAMAVATLPQLPRSLEAWPDYGVQWNAILSRREGRAVGSAGFNVPAFDGTAGFTVRAESQHSPVRLDVRLGAQRQFIPVTAGDVRVSMKWPAGGFAFVEVGAKDPVTGAPVPLQIRTARH